MCVLISITVYSKKKKLLGGLGPALGLGHLGHRLGPPTRESPQILGQNLIYLKINLEI